MLVFEIADLGARERLAEEGHAAFPRLVADQGETFDIPEVFDVELDVLPKSAGRPAVKIVHANEQPQLAMLLPQTLDLRHEMLVILFRELSRQLDPNQFATLLFTDSNCHVSPPRSCA